MEGEVVVETETGSIEAEAGQAQRQVSPTGHQARDQYQRESRSAQGAPSSEAGKLEQELARLTDPKSIYWTLASSDPKNPARMQIVDRVNQLRDAIAGQQTRAASKDLPEDEQPTPMLASVPENWNREEEAAGRDLAVSAGLPNDLVDTFAREVAAGGQAMQATDADHALDLCVKAFGKDAEATIAEAQYVYRHVDQTMRDYLDRSGLSNNVAAIKFLAGIGRNMIDAQKALDEMADPKHPYNDASHPLHREAVVDASIHHQTLALMSKRDLRRG